MIVLNLQAFLSKKSLQYYIFLALSSVIFILTGITGSVNSEIFYKYFGSIPPFLAVVIVFIIGLISVIFLLADGLYIIFKTGNIRGILTGAAWATPFAVVMILVDYTAPYPADINVPFPLSLAFYPAMGYVVEILFHLLPFCMVYLTLKNFIPKISIAKTTWIAILVTALLEPIFQVFLTSGQTPVWVTLYLGVHLFLFNLLQLELFRRYDFITMFSFRLSYYVLWHLVWGYFRLQLLF